MALHLEYAPRAHGLSRITCLGIPERAGSRRDGGLSEVVSDRDGLVTGGRAAHRLPVGLLGMARGIRSVGDSIMRSDMPVFDNARAGSCGDDRGVGRTFAVRQGVLKGVSAVGDGTSPSVRAIGRIFRGDSLYRDHVSTERDRYVGRLDRPVMTTSGSSLSVAQGSASWMGGV